MVFTIPKKEMPKLTYTPFKHMDGIAMLAPSPQGPVIYFMESDEVIFVPYDEIIGYAAGAPRKKLPEAEETDEPPKRGLREIKKPS